MNDRTITGPDHLAADDPRISEWIDGRLTAADAAAVAAAVAASAELTRVVADLRAIRETLGRLPAATPPPAFARGVIDAINAASHRAHGEPDDAAVDSEWRKIEAERIAEEREEAREDLLDTDPPRRRWPWLAFAAALAAGVIAALVLNSPAAVSRRMVASRPEATPSPEVGPAAARATPRDARPAAAPSFDGQPDRLAGEMITADEIAIVVSGSEGRALLASLLDAAGIERSDGDQQVRGTGIGEFGATVDDDRLEVSGDQAAIAAFLEIVASLPADAAVRLATAGLAGNEGVAAAGSGGGADLARKAEAPGTLRRLVVRLVADELPEASTGPSPESLEE